MSPRAPVLLSWSTGQPQGQVGDIVSCGCSAKLALKFREGKVRWLVVHASAQCETLYKHLLFQAYIYYSITKATHWFGTFRNVNTSHSGSTMTINEKGCACLCTLQYLEDIITPSNNASGFWHSGTRSVHKCSSLRNADERKPWCTPLQITAQPSSTEKEEFFKPSGWTPPQSGQAPPDLTLLPFCVN